MNPVRDNDDLLSQKSPSHGEAWSDILCKLQYAQGVYLARRSARTLIFEHCLFENGRKIHMHAFVVMPDHVHMLFTPLLDKQGDPYSLAEIMNGIKGSSSHSVNKLLRKKGRLWEPESFDRITRSDGDFEFRLLYIVQNPIAAGLARGPNDYPWAWRETTQLRAAAVHDPE